MMIWGEQIEILEAKAWLAGIIIGSAEALPILCVSDFCE